VAGLIAALTVVFTLTSPALFRGRYIVSTEVQDAGGIRKGDPVELLGVVVGRVLRFRVDHDSRKVDVYLEIEGEYPIPKDSRVEIKSGGIMGQMAAHVLPGQSKEWVKTGDFLPGQLAGGSDVMENANETVKSAKSAADQARALLS